MMELLNIMMELLNIMMELLNIMIELLNIMLQSNYNLIRNANNNFKILTINLNLIHKLYL